MILRPRHYATRVLSAHQKQAPDEQTAAKPVATKKISLALAGSTRVEQSAIEHFAEQGRAAVHIENHLYPALFGLLFWEVIFMPIAGAFHHPFQRVQRTCSSPTLGQLRSTQFAQRFKDLAALNQRQQQLTERFNEKFGLANPFVHWSGHRTALAPLCRDPHPLGRRCRPFFIGYYKTRERFAPVSQTSWSFMRPVMN